MLRAPASEACTELIAQTRKPDLLCGFPRRARVDFGRVGMFTLPHDLATAVDEPVRRAI
jgi:hypothetical protein